MLLSLGAVAIGFRQKRSSVAFVNSVHWWILLEGVFCALVGSNSAMVIELA